MRKRFVSILLSVAMLLSGCQLAIPEETMQVSGMAETDDMIVGMLVTLDSVEPNPVVNEEALHLISNQGKRIYAEFQEETYESHDGTMRTTHRMVFPEGLGLTFMGYEITPEILPTITEEETYWTNTMDDGVLMEKNNYKTVNDESFVQLEAAIYVSDMASDLVFYMNPVYQNEAGEVYALGVSPMGYNGVSMYDCSVSYGTTLTESMNGEVVDEERGYVKMTIRVVHVPDFYRIVQMDENNKILKTEDIHPSNLPKEYAPEENCAYLILEEYTEGQDVKRSVKGPDDQDRVLEVIYPMENGICHFGHTQVNWEGAE